MIVSHDKNHVDRSLFLIITTLAGFRSRNKESWGSPVSSRDRDRERERKNSRQGNWRNKPVCVIWNVAADFAGTAPRIFLSLGKRARVIFAVERKTWAARTHHSHESTHPRVLGKSRSREASFTVSGTWSRLVRHGNRSRNRPPLLLSILIESKRHGHGFPRQTNAYTRSDGVSRVIVSLASAEVEAHTVKFREFVLVKLRTE